MLNIYVPNNSNSLSTILNGSSIVNSPITWANDMATNNRYFNTAYNIYIYPVENVANARLANGD